MLERNFSHAKGLEKNFVQIRHLRQHEINPKFLMYAVKLSAIAHTYNTRGLILEKNNRGLILEKKTCMYKECGKAFRQRIHLSIHQGVYTRVKPL
jgi:hypothetical protein